MIFLKEYEKDDSMGAHAASEKISKYFTWGEMTTTEKAALAAKNIPNAEAEKNLVMLATTLDTLRAKFGPIKILSGYRSPELQAYLRTNGTPEEQQQASAYSYHEEGIAADIRPMTEKGAKTAQQVFATVAGTPSLAKLFGEFALKKNSIHLSLPTTTKQQYFMYVNELNQYIKYGAAELTAFVKANKVSVGIGLGVAFLAAAATTAFIIIKRRRG